MEKKLISIVTFHTRALQQAGALIGNLSRAYLSSCNRCSMCSKPATFTYGTSRFLCDRCEAERRVSGQPDSYELDIAEDIRMLEVYAEALDSTKEVLQ